MNIGRTVKEGEEGKREGRRGYMGRE